MSARARWFALALLGAAAPSSAAEPDITWYTIVTENGIAIGHASEEVTATAEGREIVDTQEIDLEEPGTPAPTRPWFTVPKGSVLVSRAVFRQDKDGRTIAIQTSSKNGEDWSRDDAAIGDTRATITHATPAETRVVTVALPAGVRFDNGEGLLRSWNPATAPKLAFDNFNIDAMAVEHVTIEATAGGILRKRFEGSELRAVARLVLGADGRIAEVHQPMFGTDITIRVTDRETALRAHPRYHVLANVMRKSPYRISKPAMTGHIRYRFGFLDGIEFALPQTGEQRVAAVAGIATVDICSGCGPGLATDAATLADALKPTAWLQSDAPAIKAIADPIARLSVSGTQKMEMLRRKGRPYLGRVDFAGHYSALETLARRAGDCTEAAVLLAALGRAAGIPTRVVNGLVYSRESYHGVSNVFMPHSWTLAYVDGAWRSFDMALDTFDSTHIALTVGDGDERSLAAANQLAGLLRWDAMSEVRARPAN